MSKPAIEVRGISKSYKISKQLAKNSHPTIAEDFKNVVTKPFELVGIGGKNKKEDFWALKDISFEVQPGEVLGVVGRNGSGKSTLFKILSRITQPIPLLSSTHQA